MNTLQDHTVANLAQLAPILDEAIDKLDTEDRNAILLRFFEQLDFRSVGVLLDTNEDAARKRVSRALEKLHSFLKHRGVTLSAAALGTALATEAVAAAPVGLAASIAGTALAGAAAGGGITFTLIKAMTLTKLKFGIFGGIALACLATPLVQHRSQGKLLAENQTLQRQVTQLASLAVENERLSNLLAQVNRSPSLEGNQLSELLRLRGEVGRLREAERELGKLRKEDPRVAATTGSQGSSPASETSEQPKFFYVAGEVLILGRFVWTNGITLASAIELAHGFTDFANRSVFEIKGSDGTEETIKVESSTLLEARNIIQPGVTVFIPRPVGSDSGSADPVNK